jgi:3-methylcrotonyl-CoA carboxylase alpha subunit
MIAKIITSGATRIEALRRMREVLGGLSIAGVTTNLDFLRWLVAHPQFEMGNVSTRFIEKYYRPGAFPIAPIHVLLAGAAVRLLYDDYDPTDATFAWRGNAWRIAGQEMQASLLVGGHDYRVAFSAAPGDRSTWHARAMQGENILFEGDVTAKLRSSTLLEPYGSEAYSVVQIQVAGEPQYSLRYGWGEADDLYVIWERHEYRLRSAPALSTERLNRGSHQTSADTLESPMPGKVLRLLVGEGDSVDAEQPLVIIEAMKMEFTVRAPHDGRVASVKFVQGDQVAVGDVLIELEHS